jgi:hypothetical protein
VITSIAYPEYIELDELPDEGYVEADRGRTRFHMALSRAAWIAVTAICGIAALLLLVNGYDGYSAVLAFVGLAAAVNLLP